MHWWVLLENGIWTWLWTCMQTLQCLLKYKHKPLLLREIMHPGIYLNCSNLNVIYAWYSSTTQDNPFWWGFLYILLWCDNQYFLHQQLKCKWQRGSYVYGRMYYMDTEGDMFFINTSGKHETLSLLSSTISIANSTKLQFINNSARTQAGGFLCIIPLQLLTTMPVWLLQTTCTASKIGAMLVLESMLYIRNNAKLIAITFINSSVQTESGALIRSSIFKHLFWEQCTYHFYSQLSRYCWSHGSVVIHIRYEAQCNFHW